MNLKTTLLGLLFFLFIAACKDSSSVQSSSKQNFYTFDIEEKLDSLGVILSSPKVPTNNYVHVVQTGNLLFLAGKGPKDIEGKNIVGRLGDNMTIEEGYQAARRIGIAQLSVLKDHLGDLNKVKRVVKVLGMVKCTDTFKDQPSVVNGFSDLMVEVFGERGKHARAAVGMSALPGGICAEIEMIVEVE